MNRHLELLYVADKCSQLGVGDLGKKKFQKLVYLIEHVGDAPLGYEYEIYFYGPYSRGLDDDLVELSHEDLIEFSRCGQSHLIHPTDQAKRELKSHVASIAARCAIDEQIERFGKRSPSDLELLTTAHYVASLLGGDPDQDAIERGVRKVKGSKFSDAKIKSAVREMALA